MKFVIEIECDNEAFDGKAMKEVARILDSQSHKLKYNDDGAEKPDWADTLRDVNGNRVGTAKFVHRASRKAAVNG